MSDQREDFEEAAARLGYNLMMCSYETGEYFYSNTQDAWNMWQECCDKAARESGGGEAVARVGITLDALSLREAAYWANPDKTPDEDETEVRIEWMPERTSTDGEQMAAGHYLYYVDCPEEGVIGPLGEDPVPSEVMVSATPQPDKWIPEVANEAMLAEGVEALIRGLKAFPDNYTQVVSNIWEDMAAASTPPAQESE